MCLCIESVLKLIFTDMKMEKDYLGVMLLTLEKTSKTVQMSCILEKPVLLHSSIYLYQSSLGN